MVRRVSAELFGNSREKLMLIKIQDGWTVSYKVAFALVLSVCLNALTPINLKKAPRDIFEMFYIKSKLEYNPKIK